MYRYAVVVVLLAAPVLAQQPFELKTEGDSITLTIEDDGMAMSEFVKLAERVTDRQSENRYRTLEKYSRDLTQMAKEGRLDPVIGDSDQNVEGDPPIEPEAELEPAMAEEAESGKKV